MPVIKTKKRIIIETVKVSSYSRQRIEIKLPSNIKKVTAVLVTATAEGG